MRRKHFGASAWHSPHVFESDAELISDEDADVFLETCWARYRFRWMPSERCPSDAHSRWFEMSLLGSARLE